MFPVRGPSPVLGDHGPAVGQLPGAGRPRVIIGSMASAVPGASRGPLPRLPWLATNGAMCMAVPMPCPPYPATEPYRRPSSAAGQLHRLLDGGGDVAEPAMRPGRADTGPHRQLAGGDQVDLLHPDVGRLTDMHRDRGIGMPAVQDAAGVDGQQVTLAQDPGRRGDAVHDLVVHRRADGRGESAVVAAAHRNAGSCWCAPPSAMTAAMASLTVQGADAGRHGRAARGDRVGQHAARARASPAVRRGS